MHFVTKIESEVKGHAPDSTDSIDYPPPPQKKIRIYIPSSIPTVGDTVVNKALAFMDITLELTWTVNTN